MIEVLLLPLAVTAAVFNVGDEEVEGDRVVVVECRSKGEIRSELEATIAKKPLIYLIVKIEDIVLLRNRLFEFSHTTYRQS
ncbi:hypothetical protein DVH24_030411 [Malus domestica]|uniref:Uncharacterized protein n=1 Tax=Malus domestica TaxID=3750 RepID=A0A498KRG9_MALDO|nr:hypothetical protein DVH24_030410 [Malus domestica]RXI09751.1 hypothetical protein DVH24_030411 [Malus domestica]